MSEPPKENKESSGNENKADQKPAETNPPPQPIPETSDKQIEATVQTKNDGQNNDNGKENPQKETIIIQKERKDGWDITLVIFNGIMALGTIAAIYMSSQALKSSNKAITLTDSTFQQAKRANDLSQNSIEESKAKDSIDSKREEETFYLTKKQFEAAIINDSISNDLNQKSLEKQIKALETTQKQFASENMAFLECRDFSFVTLEADKHIKIQFQVINVGKVPIKIIGYKLGLFYNNKMGVNPTGHLATIPADPFPTAYYVTNQFPSIQYFTTNDPLPAASYKAIKNGNLFMFFCGEITYTNEINGKKMKYTFNAMLDFPPSKEFRMVYLDNRETK